MLKDLEDILDLIVPCLVAFLGGMYAFRGTQTKARSELEIKYINEMKTIIDNYKVERKALKEQVDKLIDENSDLKKERNELKNKVQLMSAEINDLRQQVQKLQNKNKEG